MCVRTQKMRWEHGKVHKKYLFEEKCEEMHLEKQNGRVILGSNPGDALLGCTLRSFVKESRAL